MNNFSVLECPVYFDKTNMLDMLSLSAGRAILCQNRLGEQIIADNSWGLDPMKGMIRFGEREFRAGILGSESEIQNTWLWSWAVCRKAPRLSPDESRSSCRSFRSSRPGSSCWTKSTTATILR